MILAILLQSSLNITGSKEVYCLVWMRCFRHWSYCSLIQWNSLHKRIRKYSLSFSEISNKRCWFTVFFFELSNKTWLKNQNTALYHMLYNLSLRGMLKYNPWRSSILKLLSLLWFRHLVNNILNEISRIWIIVGTAKTKDIRIISVEDTIPTWCKRWKGFKVSWTGSIFFEVSTIDHSLTAVPNAI